MYFDQTIHVYVKAHHVGRSSVDIHYMVLDDKQEIALTGRGRLVSIHAKTGKPVSLEEAMRAALLEL
ncbi:acyl-CoA thioesterase [Virgibacillus proomii]|uniref:acyl-CoA thioesterase n=1 Tax=Virgibacillus proomii TaxID=84407 RepID=UPI0020A036C6|nr:thioesterase family protein [Virgibacillus proomii]